MLKYKHMRLSRKTDYALTIFACISFAAVFACLIHYFSSRVTFADANNDNGTFVVSEEHYVAIYDQGVKLTVKTDAATVREALERANFLLNSTDKVEPSLDTAINMDDFHINIYRSHPVVVIDGAKHLYAMTASYDPKSIAADAGVTIYDGDEISPIINTNFLEAGAATAYQIIRNGGRTVTVEEEIAFSEETINDYNLAPGTSEVRQLGEVGQKTTTYNILYIDNNEVSREVVSDNVTKPPVNRVVAVGVARPQLSDPSANESITWNYLRLQGFTAVQTAGIMGNLQQEHGFLTSDTAGGLGIAQWTGGRRANLLAHSNPYDIYTQLDYLMEELNGGYSGVKAALMNSTTIEDAVRVFQNQFERCGICREANRIGFAYSLYERYAN